MQAAKLLIVLLGLVALSSAVPVKVYDYYSVPHYSYKYGVEDKHTGDKKTAWETREGKVTKGAYSLVEPDGTIRVVEYHDDGHSGFNAVVKKIGHAHHPSHGHHHDGGAGGGFGGFDGGF